MPKISKFSAKKWLITSLSIENITLLSFLDTLPQLVKAGDIIKLSFKWLISKSIFDKLKITKELDL
jgi:hypothetical protein